jgi:hypothetical protein
MDSSLGNLSVIFAIGVLPESTFLGNILTLSFHQSNDKKQPKVTQRASVHSIRTNTIIFMP